MVSDKDGIFGIRGKRRIHKLLNIFALADDTTGALETGSSFASLGIDTEVWLRPPEGSEARAVVVDTRSRHCAPHEAENCVGSVVRALAPGSHTRIYKKTDSTLRGNIAAELEALVDLFPESSIVYAPAYPALGRTVEKSRLLVDGLPVELTAFGHDVRGPVRNGYLPDLFLKWKREVLSASNSLQLEEYLARDAAGGLIICDSADDDDLKAVAAVVANAKNRVITAGPAAFASAWAWHFSPTGYSKLPALQAKRGLIVSASRHPASEQQIRVAEAQGLRVHDTIEVVDSIRTRGWAILKPPADALDPNRICALLSGLASETAAACSLDALVLFGGDTASSVLEKLGVLCLKPQGDIFPGIPLSFPRAPRLPAVISKAGGFGPANVICDILRYLGN
jgi:uncharacterized protein YgbK (DUF1537 family)